MKKLLSKIALVAACFNGFVQAQQDPQFTQFMFNKLIVNPGYAGTSGAICGVMQYRNQWTGFPGTPQSMVFSGDMKLPQIPLGVGLNIMTDKSGPMSTFFLRGAAAFAQKIGKGSLGLGLDLGFLQKQINEVWITPQDDPDSRIPGTTNYTTNPDFNKLNFDIGLGVFYQIPGKMYVGLSCTHLPAQKLIDGPLAFNLSRHYYFMAGYTYDATPWLKVEPNVLYKSDIAASRLDLNLNLKWLNTFWVGGSLRTIGKINGAVLLGLQKPFAARDAIMVKAGYSYDLPTNPVSGNGTHEIFIGACFTPKIKKETTYTNDRYWGN